MAISQAMDFIHEMGWLLHRSQLKSRMVHLNSNVDLFSLKRFKQLMEYSMDHDWCAVVKKLLNLLLDGTVDAGDHPSLYLALSEMGLLHKAVRRNSRPLVELLMRYVPEKISDQLGLESEALADIENRSFLFRPDIVGPAGLTPLHIAAGKDGSEDVLDALTNDPCKVYLSINYIVKGILFKRREIFIWVLLHIWTLVAMLLILFITYHIAIMM